MFDVYSLQIFSLFLGLSLMMIDSFVGLAFMLWAMQLPDGYVIQGAWLFSLVIAVVSKLVKEFMK